MRDAQVVARGTIFRDNFLYGSHPHVALSGGEILVVFNQTCRRRFILHPPHDPLYRNVLTRSSDLGRTWTAPQVVPDYRFHGTECASLTVLKGGDVLLNQWRFHWYPLGLARHEPPPEEMLHLPADFHRELVESGELTSGGDVAHAPEELMPWARGHGETWVHHSDDGGKSFTASTQVDTGSFHGGYGMRGALELRDGTLLLPLNDIPEYRTIFTVRSRDGGRSWHDPRSIAQAPNHLFTEAALCLTSDGDILAAMRDDATKRLHTCRSSDGSTSWSKPANTGIAGYPPHLLTLRDGRVLCTLGHRQPPFCIYAVMSSDAGRTWDEDSEIAIRGGLRTKDLGYPASVELGDGSIFTVYYCQDDKGVTGIEFGHWVAD